MRRPAAGSTDSHAQTASELRGAAVVAQRDARAALREAGVGGVVRCKYLGQRNATGTGEEFLWNPSQWRLAAGARRSQTVIVYRWGLPSGLVRFQDVHANNAKTQGVPSVWLPDVVLQHRLEQCAVDAQRIFRQALPRGAGGGRYQCTYLGRRDDSNAELFAASPLDWRGADAWRSQEVVTFRWGATTGEALEQDVRAHNVCERGLRQPQLHRDGSLTDPGGAEALRQLLEEAALEAAKQWTAVLLEEHGQSCTCRYSGYSLVYASLSLSLSLLMAVNVCGATC